jgi:cell division protein FtsL
MKNAKLFIVAAAIIAGFLIYGKFEKGYHEKEIKALESEIGAVQKKFDAAVEEKEKLKDSSKVYENLAAQEGLKADQFRAKALKEKKDKEIALASLKNLSKDVIDTFFVKRYAQVPKSDTSLQLDKNVGNAVVVELVEKDHLVGQLATAENLTTTLTSQVNTLQTSLTFSKSALVSADSAIAARSKQFELQQQVSDMLKQDLKTAKNKAFWNKFKGTAVGLVVGLTVGIIAVK